MVRPPWQRSRRRRRDKPASQGSGRPATSRRSHEKPRRLIDKRGRQCSACQMGSSARASVSAAGNSKCCSQYSANAAQRSALTGSLGGTESGCATRATRLRAGRSGGRHPDTSCAQTTNQAGTTPAAPRWGGRWKRRFWRRFSSPSQFVDGGRWTASGLPRAVASTSSRSDFPLDRRRWRVRKGPSTRAASGLVVNSGKLGGGLRRTAANR